MLELFQILVGELADGMLSDRLEHILNGDGAAAERAGQDRTSIDEDRGHIEANHGHHHARKRLVAACQADQCIVGMAAHREFHGVGDHFARRQRGLHTFVTHGDAVGHGDGAELARGSMRRCHALLHGLRLAHERDVAGRGLVPAGGDADEGLVNLVARQTHRVVVGAMRRACGPLGHVAAGQFRLVEGLGVH
jgi:hypothetical protein